MEKSSRMKSLNEFCNEQSLIQECITTINESSQSIKLPYTFDIYNEGPKNKDYKITKSTIYKIFFSIDKKEEFEKEDGTKVLKFVDNHSQMIKLPLPADKITYREFPNKETTKNWTVVPEIRDYTWAGAWYSNKFAEYNYSKYNKDWNEWFTMLKPFMKGKISVTIKESDEKKSYDGKVLEIVVNNDQFNKDREEKIKELKDPKHLKEWADEVDAAEKTEIKKHQEEEEKHKKAKEEWNKWWNNLSDDEKLSWSMGYGRGSGNWTGD